MARIQVRRDAAADWTSANPTLSEGEIGFETDTGKVKVGDGTTAWTALDYLSDAAGASTFVGLTDTPAAYTSAAEKAVAVNAGGTALEFVDFPAGSGGTTIGKPLGVWIATDFNDIDGIQNAVGQMGLTPIVIGSPGTLNGLGVRNAATAVDAVIRLGVYDHDVSSGLPGSLVVDAGTVDLSATTGNQSITAIGQALSAGQYWLAAVPQGAFVTTEGVRNSSRSFSNGANGDATTFSSTAWFPLQTGVTGALPATFTGSMEDARPFIVWAKVDPL